jgi:hypothetical protein
VRITGADGRTRDLDAITGHVPEVAAAARGEAPGGAGTNGAAAANGNGHVHGGADGPADTGDGQAVLVGGARP